MSEITLREFFEEQLAAQQKLFDTKLQAERHRLEDALKNLEEAKKVQTIELARRMAELNNTKVQFQEARAEFLTRDMWERDKTIDLEWKRKSEEFRATFVPRAQHELKWQEETEWRRRQELKIEGLLDREEFLTFKEDVQQTLTLADGRTKGIAMMWGSAVAVATALASFLAIWVKR
jgi:hypothetical protein